MLNSIFNYKTKIHEQGHNYLYDDLNKIKEEAEFTEEDLKVDKNEVKVEPIVKSIPRPPKAANTEEALNPYLNPNLDSDLSATIGKLSKSIGIRKQINLTSF